MSGKLVILSAPSGAGKTTLVHHLLQSIPELRFSVSACTRPQRPNETDGIDYHFMSEADFKAKIKAHQFAEWEEVYPGSFYGTLLSEIENQFNKGFSVIFDLDVNGGLHLKHTFGEQALAIFVQPPSLQILEERLRSRASENEDKIQQRVAKAIHEMSYAPQFDYVLLNDDLDKAKAILLKTVASFLNP